MAKTVYGHMLTMLHYGSTSAELEQADIQQKFSSMEFYILHANISHRGKQRRADIASSYVLPIFFSYFVQNVVCDFKNKAVFQLITN